MKQLYFIALAAVCSMSASAAAPQIKTNRLPEVKTVVNRYEPGICTSLKIERIDNFNTIDTKGYNESTKTWSIEGDYKFTIGDYYTSDGDGTVELTLKAELEDGVLWFSEVDAYDYLLTDIAALWDETTNSLKFVQLKLGQAGQYYALLTPTMWDDTTQKLSITSTLGATFNPTTGEIKITNPANCYGGIAWLAYTDENYTDLAGNFKIYDLYGGIQISETSDGLDEVQDGSWTTVGTATLVDSWIIPSYYFDGVKAIPTDYPFNAELQQNNTNKNLYRVWKPFHSPEYVLAESNHSKFDGQIVFDITDPAHVEVKAGLPAGFKNSNGEFYVFGMLGWQIYQYGSDYNPATDLPGIIKFMEEDGQPFDTYADGVVTVNRSVFDFAITCANADTWKNNPYIVSTITLDLNSVEDLTVIEDNVNAPAEYFNLQGVRISCPAAGQLLIKKQGNSVSKIIAK